MSKRSLTPGWWASGQPWLVLAFLIIFGAAYLSIAPDGVSCEPGCSETAR